MRRLIVIISLLFSIVGSHAQTVTWQNTYRENDLLKWKQITFPDISATGTSVIWDISQCRETSDEDYIVELFNIEEEPYIQTAAIEQDTRYVYCLHSDSLLITGFENHTALMNYDMCEAWLKFPTFYGDSIEGYFHGKGKYCDRLGLRHYGRYKTIADGTGCLVLAEGDTLQNVIRLHTERIMSAEVAPIELLDSLSPYNTDSIHQHLLSDTALIRTDICRWYASGYRYPILETRQRFDSSGEHVLSALAYYFPPSEQASLRNDPENEQNRTRSCDEPYKQGDSSPQQPFDIPLDMILVKPHLELTPDGQEITLYYSISQESLVSYRLYSLDGYLLKECQPQIQEAGSYHDRIPLLGHNYAVFLLNFQINNNYLSEKLTLKK